MHFDSVFTRMAAVLAALAFVTPAHPQTYPFKPVKVISGYAAGGPVDIFGRMATAVLSESMAQPFILETKAGASGVIAGEYVAKAAPDGYTLLVTVPSLFTMVPFMTDKPRVNASEFVPVGQIAEAPLVLVVNPQVPAKTVKELVTLLKNSSFSYATPGNGTLPHLATELFLSRVSGSSIHVPYKGSSLALQDLVGGQVNFAIDNIAPALPLIQAGRLVALAVTSHSRFAGLPSVPTMMEAGVDRFEVTNWFGLFAPAGTPADVVQRLSGNVAKIAASPGLRQRMVELGASPISQRDEDTKSRIAAEAEQWGPLIRKLGIKAN